MNRVNATLRARLWSHPSDSRFRLRRQVIRWRPGGSASGSSLGKWRWEKRTPRPGRPATGEGGEGGTGATATPAMVPARPPFPRSTNQGRATGPHRAPPQGTPAPVLRSRIQFLGGCARGAPPRIPGRSRALAASSPARDALRTRGLAKPGWLAPCPARPPSQVQGSHAPARLRHSCRCDRPAPPPAHPREARRASPPWLNPFFLIFRLQIKIHMQPKLIIKNSIKQPLPTVSSNS